MLPKENLFCWEPDLLDTTYNSSYQLRDRKEEDMKLFILLIYLIFSTFISFSASSAQEESAIFADLSGSTEDYLVVRAKFPRNRAVYDQLKISRQVPWETYVGILNGFGRLTLVIHDPVEPQGYTCNSETNECTCTTDLDCLKMDKSGDCIPTHEICIHPPCTCKWDH